MLFGTISHKKKYITFQNMSGKKIYFFLCAGIFGVVFRYSRILKKMKKDVDFIE